MNHYNFVLFVSLLIFPHALSKIKSNPESTTQSEDRTGKGKSIIKTDFKNPDFFLKSLISVFSIFSIVQFKNNGCTTETTSSSSSATYRNGTCFTSAECNNKGGTSSGSCAGGKKSFFKDFLPIV